ncbi:hypothetical protein Pfo_011850 [Paulownia fortunei]|nr:hypothetical protein Pfo_011850 [Paulownia fortunei]
MLISTARKSVFFDLDEKGQINHSDPKSHIAIMDQDFDSSEDTPKEELWTLRWQWFPRHHIEIEDTKFLDKLGTQKQLKYLSLRGISRITTLPPSIRTLASDIGSLSKLTHFIISECYLLEGLPKGLEKISSLEVLKGYVVIDYWRKNPCSLWSLSELKALRTLNISVGTESKQERKPHVLTITWQMRSSTDNEEEEGTTTGNPVVSASLPMLEKLDLRCCPSRRLPQWILPKNLRKLKRLYIRGGKLQTLLPVAA